MRPAAPLASAALLLAGCNQSTPTSMDLLRDGNPAICTAADVEETVRQLIRPKGEKTDAYTISFADASLESFDKVVSRATCNAALTIDGPNGSVAERTMVDFTVSPAAQDPSSFIVSGAFSSFTERLSDAIAGAEADRAEQDSERQAQEALAAMVKPGWLVGRWVPTTSGSDECSTGSFDDYQRGGRLVGLSNTGRWQLAGQEVTVIMPKGSGSYTITDASMNAFTMEDANGEQHSFRRCEASEIQAGSPNVIERMSPTEGSDNSEAEPDDVTPQ